ncbi:hypothetical protein [Thiomicrorhabdus sp.]|uniref:hypothetical protein n=1 Tax=Thiomicrorhabdus sp. TaxID=2039724 RepID=UPI0029C78F89|nr:hypothetical protein [Thiomicrorhabdus sp.]
MENLTLGAKGWQRENWLGTFYPDDMPEEWQLDYYANEFRALLVPFFVWSQWDDEQIEEIDGALENPFACCFELLDLPDIEVTRKLESLKTVLGSRAFAVVLRSDEVDLQKLDQDVAGLPVTLVAKQSALPGWQWQYNGAIVSGQLLGYVDSLPETAKERTELLRSFVAGLPETVGTVFLIDVDELSIDSLRQMKLMAELLGY